jgi:hypothetical protein
MVSPTAHVAPTTVHYYMDSEPTSLGNIYFAHSNREVESCFHT